MISFKNFPLVNKFCDNFKKAVFHNMCRLSNQTDWNTLKTFSDVNLALDWFYNKIEVIFNISVPLTKCNKQT